MLGQGRGYAKSTSTLALAFTSSTRNMRSNKARKESIKRSWLVSTSVASGATNVFTVHRTQHVSHTNVMCHVWVKITVNSLKIEMFRSFLIASLDNCCKSTAAWMKTAKWFVSLLECVIMDFQKRRLNFQSLCVALKVAQVCKINR